MTNLLTVLRSKTSKRYSIDDWLSDRFTFGGIGYSLMGLGAQRDREDIENNFQGYVHGAYKSNGVVFATILARLLLFTEARFVFQEMRNGRPGDLFTTPELSILDKPWPNGTTGELLARMEQDVSLAGNCYIVREPRRLRRLRPDWVSIILTAPPDEAVESDVAGYLYHPGGLGSSIAPQTYLPHEVAHWSPIPDPDAQYRGMSWLTPVLREITADKATTLHKERFFNNGATPNMVVLLRDVVNEAEFAKFHARLNNEHQGAANAYKTLVLGGGADVKIVGADMKQLDFKATQGAGETRITAAGGVPAVIVGLSEGLQAATYSNFGQARRKFGDHWGHPQWRSASAALATIVSEPANARLWYDHRDIAFLREDEMDAAEILSRRMLTIESGVRAGYEPTSIVDAVVSGDLGRLKHTGLFSVQLQPPGSGTPATSEGNQGEDDSP